MECDDGGFAFVRHWQKFETGSRYDAECPLRTDQQIAKIVPGVVLFQPSQPVPDAPVGQHRLEPKRQIPRIAVGEHGRAPCVRREHAADHCAAFRSEAQREQAVCFLGGILRFEERHAGFDDHRAARRVDIANAPQSGERQHNFVAVRRRNLASNKTGIATLRDDADVVLVGQRQNPRHLFRRSGAQHHRRLARIAVAPLAQVGSLILGARQRMRFADDRGETFNQTCGNALQAHAICPRRVEATTLHDLLSGLLPVVDERRQPGIRQRVFHQRF